MFSGIKNLAWVFWGQKWQRSTLAARPPGVMLFTLIDFAALCAAWPRAMRPAQSARKSRALPISATDCWRHFFHFASIAAPSYFVLRSGPALPTRPSEAGPAIRPVGPSRKRLAALRTGESLRPLCRTISAKARPSRTPLETIPTFPPFCSLFLPPFSLSLTAKKIELRRE